MIWYDSQALIGFAIPDSKRIGSAGIACLLAEYGADIALKNNSDQTPLDLCLDEALSEAINEHHRQSKRLVFLVHIFALNFACVQFSDRKDWKSHVSSNRCRAPAQNNCLSETKQRYC